MPYIAAKGYGELLHGRHGGSQKQNLLIRFEKLLQERDIILQDFELLLLNALFEIPLILGKSRSLLLSGARLSDMVEFEQELPKSNRNPFMWIHANLSAFAKRPYLIHSKIHLVLSVTFAPQLSAGIFANAIVFV